ncbi:hypothetical protein L6452_42046 [Arctium lappa]|uniref:Uncharacterized protein n=1 Tax=Arctium lappa TaxID=4217 RepID=A0ACB8XHV2_ARCLA|nr:hypothetical protein L6452_42046 [Arctium lappa]
MTNASLQVQLSSFKQSLHSICCNASDRIVFQRKFIVFKVKATAFDMNSVVYVPRIKPETIAALSAFCEKASMVNTGDVWLHQLCR